MRRRLVATAEYHTDGFTIVELLVVIVIIAILAAISVVAYTGIQNRAIITTLKSDLSQAAKQLAIAHATDGVYPVGSVPPSLLHASPTNTFQYTSDGTDYCLTITSTRSAAAAYRITNSGSTEEGVCSGHTGPTTGGGTVASGDPIQTVTDANCPTERTMVVDARDDHTYWVQRLADGNCWMLTNLAYAGGGNNAHGDTRVIIHSTSGNSYTEPRYYIPTGANPTTTPTVPSANTAGGGSGGERQYGYLYNWCAAMGGQATTACANALTPAADMNTTVCPAGWRLPTGTSTTGEFALLNSAINGGASGTDAGLRTEWLAQRGSLWNSGFDGQGNYSRYWSSTQTPSSATSALNFYFYSTSVNSSSSSNKGYGFAVRCIAI